MTAFFLETVTDHYQVVETQHGLHDWFVALLRATVVPDTCVVS